MAAGLSDHVWGLEEIVMMADNYLPKPGKRGPYKKRYWGGLFSERMAIMGPISMAIGRLIDKLPRWAQLTLMVFVVLEAVYCIARYGFFSFLLRMILTPLP
jgi:hypothetical protein